MTTATAEDRDLVGPYRLIKAIGAGGSARIDLARIDRAYGFQRHVVLKRPLEHLRTDSKAAASLQREARIGGRLRHPNLVSVLDAGVHDHYDYLVLEYIHGASLRTLMQTEVSGPAGRPGQDVRELPLGVALAIVTDTARGLHHAHELTDEHSAPLGLVHRDVSPGNVLIGLDGTVKLADFGIAKETRVTTLSGSMHGTVTYMAPEQCRGHAFDRRADVFSLGVILYELDTGVRLFWADNDVASLHRVLSGTVPRPRKVKPTLPAALEDIVLTALAQDPDKRYASARELGDAVERFAVGSGEVLTARSIARWVEEVLGPRDVPWLGATTIPDVAPRGEGSLVALIAASGDDEPRAETFGDGDVIDPIAEPRVVTPVHRDRGRFATMIGLGLAAGIAAVVVIASFDVTDPAPIAPVVVPPTATPSSVPTVPTTELATPTPAATPPAVTPIPKKKRARGTPATAIVQPPEPEPVGSGSQVATPVVVPKPRPKWDPTLLLPTDKGSGGKR